MMALSCTLLLIGVLAAVICDKHSTSIALSTLLTRRLMALA